MRNPFKKQPRTVKATSPDDVESQIEPSDETTPEMDAVHEAELVAMVMKRFRAAQNQRRVHERDWLMSMAFERGNQWVEYHNGTLRSIKDPQDPYRSYETVNLIKPIIKKLKTRATMSKPDASAKPQTPNPTDVQAAGEARDILDYLDRKFDRQSQSLEWVDSTLTTSTSFLKVYWDPGAEVLVPVNDAETGQPVSMMLDVGDIDEDVVPPFEMYPDPAARSWRDCDWVIHAKPRTLTYIQERYGKRGQRVKGDTVGTADNWIEMRLDGITGDQSARTGETAGERVATVYEMWERPSAKFQNGRCVQVAGGVLLDTNIDWPYEKRDTFPFIPLPYELKFHGLWSQNAVTSLVPLQRSYNEIASRIKDRINSDKPVILVDQNSEVGVDAFDSRRNYKIVTYKRGTAPPNFEQPPPINQYWFTRLEMIKGEMEDVSGVHEVSNGSVPAGVTAGNAIELLQQSDQTQMSEFVTLIETAAKQRAEWEIALAAQYYREPRLIGISAANDAQSAIQNARSFEALQKGGQVRVEVVSGSATPKTPAARIQQWQDMARAGMLQPQALPVTAALADMMGLERSDVVTDRLHMAMQMIQQQQPDPAQQAQQQIALKAQADQANEQARTQSEIAILQAKGQIEAQGAADAFQRDLALQAHDKAIPTTTISVKAGAQGTQGAEMMAQYPVIDDPHVMQMQQQAAKAPQEGYPQ